MPTWVLVALVGAVVIAAVAWRMAGRWNPDIDLGRAAKTADLAVPDELQGDLLRRMQVRLRLRAAGVAILCALLWIWAVTVFSLDSTRFEAALLLVPWLIVGLFAAVGIWTLAFAESRVSPDRLRTLGHLPRLGLTSLVSPLEVAIAAGAALWPALVVLGCTVVGTPAKPPATAWAVVSVMWVAFGVGLAAWTARLPLRGASVVELAWNDVLRGLAVRALLRMVAASSCAAGLAVATLLPRWRNHDFVEFAVVTSLFVLPIGAASVLDALGKSRVHATRWRANFAVPAESAVS